MPPALAQRTRGPHRVVGELQTRKWVDAQAAIEVRHHAETPEVLDPAEHLEARVELRLGHSNLVGLFECKQLLKEGSAIGVSDVLPDTSQFTRQQHPEPVGGGVYPHLQHSIGDRLAECVCECGFEIHTLFLSMCRRMCSIRIVCRPLAVKGRLCRHG
jgi:hypothetical protein